MVPNEEPTRQRCILASANSSHDANRSEFTSRAILRLLGCDPGRVTRTEVSRATRHVLRQGAYGAIDFGPIRCDQSASANLTGCIVCIRRGGVIEGR